MRCVGRLMALNEERGSFQAGYWKIATLFMTPRFVQIKMFLVKHAKPSE
jgi:hypothetical protein